MIDKEFYLYDVDTIPNDVLFASCDPFYFKEHGPALIESCNKFGNDLHINILNYDDKCINLYQQIKDKLDISFTISLSECEIDPPKTRYASQRFMIGHRVLEYVNRMLIIDVDCYLNRKYVFEDKKELGLFVRDPLPGTVGWENEGTKIAAGIVLVTKYSAPFLEEVNLRLKEHGPRWFVDQVSLWQAYHFQGWYKNKEQFQYFDNQHMDWDFQPDTIIWTGKGERKFSNETYVKRKMELTKDFINRMEYNERIDFITET